MKHQLTASIVAPNVMVLNIKKATQYPNLGDEVTAKDVIIYSLPMVVFVLFYVGSFPFSPSL